MFPRRGYGVEEEQSGAHERFPWDWMMAQSKVSKGKRG
jgi:hypothetical protein